MIRRDDIPISLTQAELLIFTKALNQFHEDLSKGIELSEDEPNVTITAIPDDKDGLTIRITADSTLSDAELKIHIEKTIEKIFQLFLSSKDVKNCYHIKADETTTPPSYIIANIQIPNKIHDDFINRAIYKCTPALLLDELQDIMLDFIAKEKSDGLIELLLSYPFRDAETSEQMKLAFGRVSYELHNNELLFLFETLQKLKATTSKNRNIYNSIKIFLQSISHIRDRLISLDHKNFHVNIEQLIKLGDLENICNEWVTNDLAHFSNPFIVFDTNQLFDLISRFDKAIADSIIKQLIVSSIKLGNLKLIHTLNKNFSETFNSIKTDPLFTGELSLQAYDKLPAIKDAQLGQLANHVMERILAGIGCINHETGMLVLAAKEALAKDETERNTIIIQNDHDQIEALFELLSQAQHPLRQRFIISGTHWTAYDVQIDASGSLSILAIDSLGGENLVDEDDFDELELDDAMQNLLDAAGERFKKVEIFIALEKRLFARQGCSVFSLDDTSHLYSAEKYLDPLIYPNGLFDFLRKNCVSRMQHEDMSINVAKLPLHLMRTMQSRKLLETFKEERPGESVLNRKGDSPKLFHDTRQGFVTKKASDGLEQEQNVRLDEKLSKMKQRCLTFLTTNNFDVIKAKMRVHSLEGLRDRLEQGPKAKSGM